MGIQATRPMPTGEAKPEPPSAPPQRDQRSTINAPWGPHPWPQTAEESNAYLERLLANPVFQARAAVNRAKRDLDATIAKTCQQCDRMVGTVDDSAFCDWCAECGKKLCNTCAKEGCCGHVPMKSGVEKLGR